MVKPPYGEADISDLVSAISGFTVNYISEKDNDFVAHDVTDLAKYNLDPAKAEVLRLEFTKGEGKEATTTALLVGVSKKVGDKIVAEKGGDKKEGDKFYAALDQGKAKDIVRIPVTSVEPFVKVLADPEAKLQQKALRASSDDFQVAPDAIDVTNTYRKSYGDTRVSGKPVLAPSWELYLGKDGITASPIDESEVRRLIDEIKKKDVVVSFPKADRKKELGLDKPDDDLDAVVKIYAASLEKPDPKKKGKPVFKKDVKPVTVLAIPAGSRAARRGGGALHLGHGQHPRHGAVEPPRPGASEAVGLLRQEPAVVQPGLARGGRDEGRAFSRRRSDRDRAREGSRREERGQMEDTPAEEPEGPIRQRPGGARHPGCREPFAGNRDRNRESLQGRPG